MSPFYNALNTWLGQSLPWAHRTHLTTCIIMVAALIQRGEVSLTRWLPYLPCRGLQAQSKQRRVSRWFHNLSVRSPDFALSWRWPPSMSPLKGLMLSHRASAAALTPIGFAVTANQNTYSVNALTDPLDSKRSGQSSTTDWLGLGQNCLGAGLAVN
jgi:hypothetical protein